MSYQSKFTLIEKKISFQSDAELDTELIVHKIGSLNWKHPTVSVEFATENFVSFHLSLFNKVYT